LGVAVDVGAGTGVVEQEIPGEIRCRPRAVAQPDQHAIVVDEKATRGAVAEGLAAAQAALSASMIGPSGILVSAEGVWGDWPCLANRMITVLPARWRSLIASTMAPMLVLM